MEELEPEQLARVIRDRNEAILIFAASLALIGVTIAVARREEILQAAYFAGSTGAGFSFWATWRLRRCLDEGERVLAAGTLSEASIERWSRLNAEFHGTIVRGSGSGVIADAIARNDHLPFASADSITIDRRVLEREHRKLQTAQLQHRLIVDALQQRESARVEQLMREHAWVGFRYGQLSGLGGGPINASAG